MDFQKERSVLALLGLSITTSALAHMGELARGLGLVIVVPSSHSTKYEIVRRYQVDILANGSKEFSLASLEGYMSAAVLAKGPRRAGSSPTRGSVQAGIAGIGGYDLGGVKISYGRTNREGSQFGDVAVIGCTGRMWSQERSESPPMLTWGGAKKSERRASSDFPNALSSS